jgi:hypothetical protein
VDKGGSGDGFVYFDGAAGVNTETPSTSPTLYLGNACRMKASTYLANPPYNQGSDAVVDDYNFRIQRVCSDLQSDGLNCVLVDVSSQYHPDTMEGDDHLPNELGSQVIANAFLKQIALVETGSDILYGDLNGDGKVTVTDVTRMLQIVIGLVKPSGQEVLVGDVKPKPGLNGQPFGDGKISIEDVSWALRRALDLETAP